MGQKLQHVRCSVPYMTTRTCTCNSDYVRLPFHSLNVDRVNDVPVLQAVLDDPTIEGVVELPIHCFEMSVAVVVGFLIGRQVTHNHLELKYSRTSKIMPFRGVCKVTQ